MENENENIDVNGNGNIGVNENENIGVNENENIDVNENGNIDVNENENINVNENENIDVNKNDIINIDENKNNYKRFKRKLITYTAIFGVLILILAAFYQTRVKYDDIVIKNKKIITTPEQFIYFYNRLISKIDNKAKLEMEKISGFSEIDTVFGPGYRFDFANYNTEINFIKSRRGDGFSGIYILNENSSESPFTSLITFYTMKAIDPIFKDFKHDREIRAKVEIRDMLMNSSRMKTAQSNTIGSFDCVYMSDSEQELILIIPHGNKEMLNQLYEPYEESY